MEEIELNRVDEITFNLFLQGLNLITKPNLRQLKLGLSDRDDLEKWTGNWVFADETLSTMLLKDPKLIVELPSLRGLLWDYNSEDVIEAFEGAYPEEPVKTLKRLLPRTAEYWKIEVEFRN